MMRKLLNEELDRLSVEEFKQAPKIPLVVILDNVRSMHNIGSVFRTSDAFLLDSICLCGITAKPPHKDIHKTALGSTNSVSWRYYECTEDAISELKIAGFEIVAVEQTEESILLQDYSLPTDGKLAIIFGHEVRGVDQKIINLCDKVIELPQYGTKHSLNISVCAGIVIWELFRKFKLNK